METDPVDGMEGVREDLRMEGATVPVAVVRQIFAEVALVGETGYWWEAVVAVRVAVTIPAAAVVGVVDITAEAAEVRVERDAVVTVQGTVVMDHRAREAQAVVHKMVVPPGTTIMVVQVEKAEGPREVLVGGIVPRVILGVVGLKTLAVPGDRRPVNVMLTRYPVAVAVAEAATQNPAVKTLSILKGCNPETVKSR